MTVPIIDVHAHLAPRLAAPVDGVVTGEDGQLVIDGHRVGVPGLYDAGRLAASLAGHGLDRAWVSAPPPTYRQGLDTGATDTWVRALDEGMRARVSATPALDLLTYLPLDQPTVARGFASEITHSVGWTATAGGASQPLHDPALDPLWQRLEDMGKPILLHPGHSPDARLGEFYLSNLLGNPVETGVAAAQLLLGGVLDNHPGLKIVLVHCGGIVPAVVGRWARGVETRRPGISAGTTSPLDRVRSLWVDTIGHHPALLDLALDVFGPDRLVLGSDYPFPMGVENPFEAIAHLDPETRAAIGRNGAVLLREETLG